MRLKSHVTVSALIRRAQAEGLFATVMHKGHEDAGVLYVKILRGREARLFVQSYNGEWRERSDGFVSEETVNEIVDRERDFDRDLWLIEIEGERGAELLEAL